MDSIEVVLCNMFFSFLSFTLKFSSIILLYFICLFLCLFRRRLWWPRDLRRGSSESFRGLRLEPPRIPCLQKRMGLFDEISISHFLPKIQIDSFLLPITLNTFRQAGAEALCNAHIQCDPLRFSLVWRWLSGLKKFQWSSRKWCACLADIWQDKQKNESD